MKKVFLDAGHGGKDPGACGNGIKEKDIVLSVTLKVGEILKRHGVVISYSRTIDEFIELGERANQANRENSNIFVSIHTNAFENSSVSGIESYSYPASTKGARLSQNIYESIINNKVYTKKRGTKTSNFSVLKNTEMAATLIELAFISNRNDADILKNRQDELASSVAQGILKYLGIKYIKNNKNRAEIEKIYRVQVGAYKNKANAEKLIEELRKKGYKTFIV